ncbi:hypothetical protein GGR54DRAFT_36175 [Hypoxylon sp. NC1633]|nr:hypothetical protein GGR54DRAFT_36175 [Hypoxylon sp. NC1633]
MLASLTTLLTTLALTGANPIRRAAETLSYSNAYYLQAQLLDPAKDLEAHPVAGTYLSALRVGAGLNAAIVTTDVPTPETVTPFYSNGTNDQYWVVNDLGSAYPWVISLQGPTEYDYSYPAEHDVNINAGVGTEGVEIVWSGVDSATLVGPNIGSFAVCYRFIGAVRNNELVVRYLYDGEELPEQCVGVKFVPQCATLEELPSGGEWNHDFVQQVHCIAA